MIDSIKSSFGKVRAKIEKQLSPIFFGAIQPNSYYDMLLMSSQRSSTPKQKLPKRFRDWPFPSLNHIHEHQ